VRRKFIPLPGILLFSLALFAFTSIANAAVPTGGQADPGRVRETFERVEVPKIQHVPLTVELPEDHELDPKADKIKFKLVNVVFHGNTVLSSGILRREFAGKIGKVITLGDLRFLTRKITVLYRQRGYVFSRAIIPPQTIQHGILKIKVIEGFIDRVKVEGNVTGHTADLLYSYAERVSAVRPLRIDVLERFALLANDLPGITAKTVLTPSKSRSGAADLTFVVKRKAFDLIASVDNRGTRIEGPIQRSIAAYINSWYGSARTGFRFVSTAEPSELKYYELTHQVPLGSNGWSLLLRGDLTRTEPGSDLKPFDVQGLSRTYAFTLTHPIIRSRRKNVFVRETFEIRNSKSEILGEKSFDDRIRSVRVNASLDFVDNWRGVNLISAEGSVGFHIFGATKKGASKPSRLGAHGGYQKYNLDLSRLQMLPFGFSAFIALSGQYSHDELLSAEEFGLGGSQYVRGYDPSELVGDHGFAGKAEARWDTYPIKKFLEHAQFYIFYDGGVVWNENTDTQIARESITSTGFGARIDFNQLLSAQGEFTFPLTRDVNLEENRHSRAYFSVTARV